MKEFWQQFRGRRENPCYTLLARRRGAWRRMLPAILSVLAFAFVCSIEWNEYLLGYVLLFSPVVFWLLVPITFLISMPRRADLDELALTRLSREEIAFGLMLRPLVATLPILIIYLLFVAAGLYYIWSELENEWELLYLIFSAFLINLLALLIMQLAAVRINAAHFYNPIRAFVQTVLAGLVLAFFLVCFLASASWVLIMGMEFLSLGEIDYPSLIACLFVLCCWIAGRMHMLWTWRKFPARLFRRRDAEEPSLPLWVDNERTLDEDKRRASLLSLASMLRRLKWTASTAVFALLMPWAVVAVLLSVDGIAEGVITRWRFPFDNGVTFLALAILGTTVYLHRVSRKNGGRLPLVSGALLKTTLCYAFAPLLLSLIALVLSAGTELALGRPGIDPSLWLFSAVLVVPVQLIVLLVFLINGGRRTTFLCLLSATLLLLSVIPDSSLNNSRENWFITGDLSGMAHILVLSIAALMCAAGFPLLFQRLHDRRTIHVPRGELTEPLP